jgi:hypothetical protein
MIMERIKMEGFNMGEIEVEMERISPTSLAAHLDRTRPYDGQPHTDYGDRGKQEINGVTMRDITDAFFRACFEASGLAIEDWPASIYNLPWNDMDIVAVSQNLTCQIEKLMGIYPNVPRLLPVDPTEEHWCGKNLDVAVYRSHEGDCDTI